MAFLGTLSHFMKYLIPLFFIRHIDLKLIFHFSKSMHPFRQNLSIADNYFRRNLDDYLSTAYKSFTNVKEMDSHIQKHITRHYENLNETDRH